MSENQEDTLPDSPLIDSLKEEFGGDIGEIDHFAGKFFVEVSKSSLSQICSYLKNDQTFDYLSCITGLHHPPSEEEEEEVFELIYTLYSMSENKDLNLKVFLEESESVESLYSLWESADWFEREIYDMFGVEFDNHPNLKRILMDEDWEGYPLRKDYPLEGPSEAKKDPSEDNNG